MDREILFRGKHIHALPQNKHLDGTWVYGYLCDENYIKTQDEDEYGGKFTSEVLIDPETVCRCTGKKYMNGEIAYEGDIYKNPGCGVVFVLKYGTYTAYCPADDTYMDNVGFYAEAEGYPQMPIGDLSTYALKIGNIFDNPELLKEET